MSNEMYAIEARSLSLGGVASHNFWVLRDGQNRAVAEIHGFATDRRTGQTFPIGVNEDHYSLRVWHFPHAEIAAFGGVTDRSTYISEGQAHRVVFQGPKEEALARWKGAVDAARTLNALDRDYPTLGFKLDGSTVNSNSTYRTLGEIMGLPIRDFRGFVEPGIENRMVPREVIEQLRVKGYPVLDEPSINTGDGYRPLRDEPKTLWNRHDDPLFRQTLAAVHALDDSMRRMPDETSDRMAAHLAALARSQGLERVDQVVLSVDNGRVRASENVFVVQGGLMDATNRVAFMKTDAVVLPPGDGTLRALSMDREATMAIAPAAESQVRSAPVRAV